MKKFLILVGILVCITVTHVVFGQPTQGVIHYEVKVNMHRRLPPERQAMKEMMPEFNIHHDLLFFNATESFYKTADPEEEPEDDFEEGPGPKMVIRRPQTEVYLNRETSELIRSQEFIGKKFLIRDTLKILPWKFGSETKQVLGYNCRQATYFDPEQNQNITAWYTENLLPFLGPEGMCTLPGTVLQLDFNNGDRYVTATKIETRHLEMGEIRIPNSGQRITKEEFRKLVDDRMKRMGGNGNIMIRN
jgi:GLPGLI family protein